MKGTEPSVQWRLIREPGHIFTKIIIMLAEGLGLFMNADLTERAVREWIEAGRPTDWLFVVTGGKKRPWPWNRWTLAIMDNLSLESCDVVMEMEMTRLYSGLVRGGVPPRQIIYERDSKKTVEQREFVFALLQRVLVSPVPSQFPATLVSTDIHASRAVGIFNKGGKFVVDPEAGSWTARYKRDITNPFNSGNWYQWLSHAQMEQLERLVIYENRKKGYL